METIVKQSIPRPTPDFHSGIHTIEIEAHPRLIFQAIEMLKVGDIPIMRMLFAIRSLPSLLSGKGSFFGKGERTTLLQGMEKQGFRILKRTDEELVFGVIGKPWKAVNPEMYVLEELSAYSQDPPKGMLKAIGSFEMGKRVGEKHTLLHITEVFAPEPDVKRKFAPYWTLIFPGAYLIRWAWLRAIKRKAEALKKINLANPQQNFT